MAINNIDKFYDTIRDKLVSLKPIYTILHDEELERSKFDGHGKIIIIPKDKDKNKDHVKFEFYAHIDCVYAYIAGINIYIDVSAMYDGEELYGNGQLKCIGITLQKENNTSEKISNYNKQQIDVLTEQISTYVESCYVSYLSKYFKEEIQNA